MSKKAFAMNNQELGDAFEERVATALKGRLQIGSGRVKVPTLRSDVLAIPFLIECKATKNNHITFSTNVWDDLLKKVKETQWLPAYGLSVVDQWGYFYDFVGIDKRLLTDEIVHKIAPMGLLQSFDVKRTKKISCLIDAQKNRQYIEVVVNGIVELSFLPLDSLKYHYKDLIKDL